MSKEWIAAVVDVAPPHAEAVANFLIECGSPGIQMEEDGLRTRLIAHYLGAAPLDRIASYCRAIGACDAELHTYPVSEQDWAETWKAHFHAIAVGERLWVCPPWEASPPANRIAIVIEPGMAFGTGHHASTMGCLEVLEPLVTTEAVSCALDLGTGSGILAIALAKLGVSRVEAIDKDPVACAVARQNVDVNGVAEIVRVDEVWHPEAARFDLLVANLYADLLIQLSDVLVTSLKSHAILVCAGFLRADADRVTEAHGQHGAHVLNRWERDGWCALSFRRHSP